MGGEGRGKGRLAIPVLACFRRRCIIETVTSHHQCYGDALFVATTSLLLLIIIIFIHQTVVDIKRRNKTIINKYLHNQTTQLISPFTNDFFQMLCMLCFLSIVILLETSFFCIQSQTASSRKYDTLIGNIIELNYTYFPATNKIAL